MRVKQVKLNAIDSSANIFLDLEQQNKILLDLITKPIKKRQIINY